MNIKRLRQGCLIIGVLCLCITPYAEAAITGPHNIANSKGVCANCHLPHKAKGKRIWARDLMNRFDGVRQLCNSCHDGTFSQGGINPGSGNSPEIHSGIDTVFGADLETHVMHEEAKITTDEWLGPYNSTAFPLDPTDKDKIPGHPPSWDEGGAGFYCGSCHDPHKQPTGNDTNGDYLRTTTGDVGVPENRSPFCKECHDPVATNNSHLTSENCQACHHPHQGYKRAQVGMGPDELMIIRLTFRAEVAIAAEFVSAPNVPKINDPSGDPISSGLCYGCHQARHTIDPDDPNYNFWRDEGAAPIYGDEINGDPVEVAANRRNHHPMGTQAKLTGTSFPRAPGAEATLYLNQAKELTCTSCHQDLHGIVEGKTYDESKENNFLRWEFANDDAEFCLRCHSNKRMSNGHIFVDQKHFWGTDSPLSRDVYDRVSAGYTKTISCRQCMFCHFIHDGEERTTEVVAGTIRADIDALMRQGPKNLAWGDRAGDTGLEDYEDMCYGCHGETSIVQRPDLGLDALLMPGSYFTHRFASPPDPNSPTAQNIIPGGVFPLSDGALTETLNDYGTVAGSIYCGTCHNVHAPYDQASPYLNSGTSPYAANGFCEECHDNAAGNFVMRSHPIATGPNDNPIDGSPTLSAFPAVFTAWSSTTPSSGRSGGVVTDNGEVICLTCHNTHAAVTNWDGTIPQDTTRFFHGQLLVMNNFVREDDPAGSEMCKACHSSLTEGNEIFPEDKHGASFADNVLGDGRKMGICNACHSPHNSIGPKIWSRRGYSTGPFAGYRQLCYPCHNPQGIGTSGRTSVFKVSPPYYDIRIDPNDPDLPMDHVMHAAADISQIHPVPGLTITVDNTDADTFPPPDPYRTGGEFYCGSCHNPHAQPFRGGSYLRSVDGLAGTTNVRISFCDDCHPDAHGGIAGECLNCHSVHLGAVLPRINETESRWVLKYRIRRTQFAAIPNVQNLSEDPNELQNTDSPFCYGCHGPEGAQNWEEAGALPIYGDDAPAFTELSREHHPMGSQATVNSMRAVIPAGQNYYNAAGELTCKSCHDDIHGPGPFAGNAQGARDNYFLRWEFISTQKKDQTAFCVACHDNKPELALTGGHLVTKAASPNNRGGCMFCHFIHDGLERQSTLTLLPDQEIRADVDALMREPAIALIWKVGDLCADNSCTDTDPYDYEDMCYGCHGKSAIVKGTGSGGALLQPAAYFTHRYTVPPDPNSPTSANIKAGAVYPLSDGDDETTLNDYGTQAGSIFCGTCHGVHDGRITPYLNHAANDDNLAVDKGFCEACHDEGGGTGEFVQMSHPVNVDPNPPATSDDWLPVYYEGGSGALGGITGETANEQGTVVCLTCHNVHACVTSFDGHVDGASDAGHGMLLVKDNTSTDMGSDMCRDCHPF